MNTRPLFLLSNDDGYNAPGLRFLIDVLKPFADLVVVAPNSGRSGMSTAITVKTPLDLTQVSDQDGVRIYRSNGTPVDCVKLALNVLLHDRKPDFVFSGVNHGSNASVAIHYSGTMGAVLEACMNGIPGIGLSLDNHSQDADFEPSRPFLNTIVREVLQYGLPKGICLNINIPDTADIQGIRVCRQSVGRWVEEFDVRKHPRGGEYYWLTGNFSNDEPEATDNDMHALDTGFISIVPSQIDMTAYHQLNSMNTWNL